MSIYQTSLQRRDEIAEGTMTFDLAKPAGFAFRPGQAIDLILVDSPGIDAASARHTFSIVSAPFEDRLSIATRMRDSAYKRALKALAIGAAVRLEGPFGSLTLHNDRTRPAVFIAGGIGITPFMSILRQATQDQLVQRLVLVYSNRRPEDSAFLEELQQLERENQHFKLVATMTQIAKSKLPWQGETRTIDATLLQSIGAAMSAPIYYLAGPPGLVNAMRLALNDVDVNDDDIRSEEFYGY